jgi:hypothetical protein
MLSNRKVLVAKQPRGKVAAPKAIDLVPGWRRAAAQDHLKKLAEKRSKETTLTLKEEQIEPMLVKRAIVTGRAPETLRPIEGEAGGHAEFGRRPALSGDVEATVERINDLTGGRAHLLIEEQSRDVLDPDADPRDVEKAAALLKKAKLDIFVSEVKLVPAVNALNDLCRLANELKWSEDTVRELLSLVAVTRTAFTWDGTDEAAEAAAADDPSPKKGSAKLRRQFEASKNALR